MNFTKTDGQWLPMSRTQYLPPMPRWRLLIPDFNSTMSTLPVCAFLLLTSAGLMMSESTQLMLCGAVLAGAVLGSVFQVTRALVTKSEIEMPRQVIIFRFVSHATGGCIFGILACLAAIYWLRIEMPLVLMGVVAGGLCGQMSEAIAKKFQPKIIEMLERTGRIPPRELPPTTREINLSAPTRRLDPPSSSDIKM